MSGTTFPSDIGDFDIGLSPIGAAVPGGTNLFGPPLSDMMVDIMERVGIDLAKVETRHVISCRRSMNLVQSDLANIGINAWTVRLFSTVLVQGQAAYPVAAGTIDLLDAYLTLPGTGGGNVPVDIGMAKLSRSDYANIPQKLQAGRPTSLFYFDAPSRGPKAVYTWPVADGNGPYILNWYGFMQMYQADPMSGAIADVPARFYRAYVSAVSADLSLKYAPEKYQMLAGIAADSMQRAADGDTEKVNLNLAPSLDDYFR
jgi:hypothetical protein